jgi:excisionase family DNA binding protein
MKPYSVEEEPLLSPKEFHAAMRGTIGRDSLYGLLEAKRIKSIRIGKRYLIPASEIRDFPAREAEVS